MTSFVAYLADVVNSGIYRISLLTRRRTKIIISPAGVLALISILLLVPVLDNAVDAANINGTNRDDVLRGTSRQKPLKARVETT
jgi:hypothetical protein